MIVYVHGRIHPPSLLKEEVLLLMMAPGVGHALGYFAAVAALEGLLCCQTQAVASQICYRLDLMDLGILVPCLLQDLWPQYVSPRHTLSVSLQASALDSTPNLQTSNLCLVPPQHHHPVVVNLLFFSTQPHSQTLLASPFCRSSPHFRGVLL